MNDSLPPLPRPQATPFSPEKTSGGGGCQRPLLVGCGLLSLLLGIAAVIFVVKAKDVLAYAMNQLRVEVMTHLPEDATDSESRRVEAGFDAALERIRSGELDAVALQDLQKKLTGAASAAGSRRLTREELVGLMAALDRFNRSAADTREGDSADSGDAEVEAGPEREPMDESAGQPAEQPRPPAP